MAWLRIVDRMRNWVDTELSVGGVGIASGLKNQAKKIVPNKEHYYTLDTIG